MRVILAPDSFKGSLTAAEAADAMAAGIARVDSTIEVDRCPISDGGEGFVDAMVAATDGEVFTDVACGPLQVHTDARWGILGDRETAVLELASVAGLGLVPDDQRDPTKTTTWGMAELIGRAARAQVKEILIGIGGSATNDGGTGMAQALGVRFFDQLGNRIIEPMCGGLLERIHRIERPENFPGWDRDIAITVACDVTNPLTGPNGASAVYGPQKGATPPQVAELDNGLRHLAKLLREQWDVNIEQFPGAGAAGGMGAGLVAFLGAGLRPGIELVLDATRFDQRAAGCALCLTGEGRLDGQSLSGKAVLGVARAAAQRGVPTVALVGSAGDDAENTLSHGLNAYHTISDGHDEAYAMQHAAALLTRCAERVVREWVAGHR